MTVGEWLTFNARVIRASALHRLGAPLLKMYLGLAVFGVVFVAAWWITMRFRLL